MRSRRLVPVVLATAGVAAIVVGVHQGLLHVAPGYEGTIRTGWGGDLNHEERLLAQIGVLGLGATVATLRWWRLAVGPVVAGDIVLFYALRAVLHHALDPGLYTEVATYGGGPTVFVLGAEPFLLAAGGTLLAAAGVVGWRGRGDRAGSGDLSTTSSAP